MQSEIYTLNKKGEAVPLNPKTKISEIFSCKECGHLPVIAKYSIYCSNGCKNFFSGGRDKKFGDPRKVLNRVKLNGYLIKEWNARNEKHNPFVEIKHD